MQHTDHVATEVMGTFAGHILPGALLVAWALVWMAQAIRGSSSSTSTRTLESSGAVAVLKIALPLAGMFAEIPGQGWPPGRGWPPDAILMNWQHVTMYGVFALSGVVDVLARRGALSPQATFAAYAAAQANAGFLFAAHGGHGGVEGLVHLLLVLVFAGAAATALLEAWRPTEGLAWARRGALLAVGAWFLVIAWILYRSGWDMADPVREGWVSMIFAWTMAGAAAVTVLARLAAGRGGRMGASGG